MRDKVSEQKNSVQVKCRNRKIALRKWLIHSRCTYTYGPEWLIATLELFDAVTKLSVKLLVNTKFYESPQLACQLCWGRFTDTIVSIQPNVIGNRALRPLFDVLCSEKEARYLPRVKTYQNASVDEPWDDLFFGRLYHSRQCDTNDDAVSPQPWLGVIVRAPCSLGSYNLTA